MSYPRNPDILARIHHNPDSRNLNLYPLHLDIDRGNLHIQGNHRSRGNYYNRDGRYRNLLNSLSFHRQRAAGPTTQPTSSTAETLTTENIVTIHNRITKTIDHELSLGGNNETLNEALQRTNLGTLFGIVLAKRCSCP
ncbi:hypothetical protein KGM_209561A, partial [Danaus plexippus plexippus]